MGRLSVLNSMVQINAVPELVPAQAIVAIPVIAMKWGGGPAEVNLVRLRNLCGFSHVFQAIGPARTGDLIEATLHAYDVDGAEALLTGARRILARGDAEFAMLLAIRLSSAGRVASTNDKADLAKLAAGLGLPPLVFHALKEVTELVARPMP